jgi:hypothetical protein
MLAALGLAAMAHAQGDAGQPSPAAPWLWAAPALYGPENSACGRTGAADADTATIAPLFCAQLTPADRQAIGQEFAAAVARSFPQVEPVFGQHLPAGATAAARLRGTLVASLRLTRATHAVVRKPVGVDAYLPISLTFDITNVATGEVVFTRSRLAVAEGTFSAQFEPELARQFRRQLDADLAALVSEAAVSFRPWLQTATVLGGVSLDKDGKAWVIDRGRAAGWRTGDAVGEDGRVLYAGPDYAVVQPTLGQYATGQTLSRTALGPAALLARPGVLTVIEEVPPGYAAPYLTEVFEDAVGAAGGLAPVPVNPAFISLRQLALNSAEASLAPDARNLPDYVASVRLVVLDPATYPSNLPGVEIDHFEAHAFVQLVDATGRVVGAWHGSGLIDDKISAGIRFAADKRRDTVIRNALLDAAGKMAAFRPQPQFLPVTGSAGAMTVADLAGAVPIGASLPVLRRVGRFKGLAGEAMVPVGSVTAGEPVAAGIAVTDSGPAPLALRGGEVVALETAGTPARSRHVVAQCTDAAGLARTVDKGSIPVAVWSAAAGTLLAQKLPAPLHLASLPGHLRAFAPSFAGWDRFGAAMARAPDSCFLPLVAADQSGGTYSLVLGYALERGDERLGTGALKVGLTPTRLPPDTAAAAAAAMLQADFAAQMPQLAMSSAALLKPAP